MPTSSRRDVLKFASAGFGAAYIASPQALSAPQGEIEVRVTAGEKRFAAETPIQWTSTRGNAPAIRVDPRVTFQELLGFGGALTDAACFVLSQMPEAPRRQLMQELFAPSKMGFQVCRICMGASDYSRNVYSYDEGEPDPELKRFSIEHDREYIIPVLRSAREINPNLFLLASPWSPPGWMKPNGSMLGGCIHPMSFPAYARYFARFLKAYAEAGVPVQAVSVQNEVDTEQNGRMPACLFGQEYEIGFVTDHLGPELAKNGLDTKIWILDHNYNLWGRVQCELENAKLRSLVDGVAWHGYVGEPSSMSRVHDAFPEKHAYWTEGGPDITDPNYATDWAAWGATFGEILRNWARCIIAWNVALDESGKPNIGPFTCGGVVTVHSKTNEVSHSGQYWAFAHYGHAIRPGAKRVQSSGDAPEITHVAVQNPDGGMGLVLANKGDSAKVAVEVAGANAEVSLPGSSVVSLTWRA